MIISRILEAYIVYLSDIPPFSVKQRYNSNMVRSMRYSLPNESLILKSEPPFAPAHVTPSYNPSLNLSYVALLDSMFVEKLFNKISRMDANFKSLQDLLMSSYYKFDVIT